jgi:hypothetical protein
VGDDQAAAGDAHAQRPAGEARAHAGDLVGRELRLEEGGFVVVELGGARAADVGVLVVAEQAEHAPGEAIHEVEERAHDVGGAVGVVVERLARARQDGRAFARRAVDPVADADPERALAAGLGLEEAVAQAGEVVPVAVDIG